MRPKRDMLINKHTNSQPTNQPTSTNQHIFTHKAQIPVLLIKMTVCNTKTHSTTWIKQHTFAMYRGQMTPLVLYSTTKSHIEFMVCSIHTINKQRKYAQRERKTNSAHWNIVADVRHFIGFYCRRFSTKWLEHEHILARSLGIERNKIRVRVNGDNFYFYFCERGKIKGLQMPVTELI